MDQKSIIFKSKSISILPNVTRGGYRIVAAILNDQTSVAVSTCWFDSHAYMEDIITRTHPDRKSQSYISCHYCFENYFCIKFLHRLTKHCSVKACLKCKCYHRISIRGLQMKTILGKYIQLDYVRGPL